MGLTATHAIRIPNVKDKDLVAAVGAAAEADDPGDGVVQRSSYILDPFCRATC